jgi:arsenite-transporting ATPase
VLAVSTDPAHSLGDALGVRVSAAGTTIAAGRSPRAKDEKRGGVLRAVELDARRAFARWVTENRRALGDILEHGTWLDRQDVDALLGLSVPGVDELAGVLEIARLAGAGTELAPPTGRRRSAPTFRGPGSAVPPGYDVVVVDTAPTGHTLRLLAAPQTVGAVAEVLGELQHEHRIIREQLARVGGREAADRLIELLIEQARQTGELLRETSRTAFHWVMLPEALSLAETEDALAALERTGLHVSALVINRVLPNGPPCPVCDRRRDEESRIISRARRTIARGRDLAVVQAQDEEPQGAQALGRVGRMLSLPSSAPGASSRRRLASSSRSVSMSLPSEPTDREHLPIERFNGVRLLFVGGKGGVGKTTTAAALALRIARSEPARRVLLLSIDPAHSLGDAFGAAVGDQPVRVAEGPSNLRVRELDAGVALASRRADLESAIDEIVETFGGGAVTMGNRGIGELIDLAPPGVDELLGLVSVMDTLLADRYDLVIVDMAPTGHALRLLEMPDAAREWVQTLLRMLLKYRKLVRPGQLAAELLALSKSIRALQDLMRAPGGAHFLVVTRAADVPRRETERLLARLKRLHLNVPVVIVNAMTLGPGRCPRCRRTAAAERRQVGLLARASRRAFGDCAIIQTPLTAPPPRGANALERWARAWTS